MQRLQALKFQIKPNSEQEREDRLLACGEMVQSGHSMTQEPTEVTRQELSHA